MSDRDLLWRQTFHQSTFKFENMAASGVGRQVLNVETIFKSLSYGPAPEADTVVKVITFY